jgi:hypothetical protein
MPVVSRVTSLMAATILTASLAFAATPAPTPTPPVEDCPASLDYALWVSPDPAYDGKVESLHETAADCAAAVTALKLKVPEVGTCVRLGLRPTDLANDFASTTTPVVR